MDRPGWGAWTPNTEAARRAGGRRRYNQVRQLNADMRLLEVARLVKEIGLGHGAQARMVQVLGVGRSTISRDVAKIMALLASPSD